MYYKTRNHLSPEEGLRERIGVLKSSRVGESVNGPRQLLKLRLTDVQHASI